MKLLFASFLAAALARDGHAAQPRIRTTPKINKGAAAASDGHAVQPRVGMPKSEKKGRSSSDAADSCTDTAIGFSSLYGLSNRVDNQVLVYSRSESDGQLTFQQAVLTGGTGGINGQLGGPPNNFNAPPVPADPFGSQDPIIVAGRCILAINYGSANLSSFHIHSASEISHSGVYPTGGRNPASVAERDGLVYVLNTGGNGSIQGYNLDPCDCTLTAIGQTVGLTQGGGPFSEETSPSEGTDLPFGPSAPAQIGFTPSGDVLVTIKINGGGQNGPFGPGSLNVYKLDADGTTSEDALVQTIIEDRPGSEPFAFDFDHQGRLLLNEVFINGFVPTNPPPSGGVTVWEAGSERGEYNFVELVDAEQTFSCWLKYNPENMCAYLANTGGSISSFTSTATGLDLVESVAASLNGPLDQILSDDGQYLYVMSPGVTNGSGQAQIYVYETASDCGLREVQTISDGYQRQALIASSDGVFQGVAGLAVFPQQQR